MDNSYENARISHVESLFLQWQTRYERHLKSSGYPDLIQEGVPLIIDGEFTSAGVKYFTQLWSIGFVQKLHVDFCARVKNTENHIGTFENPILIHFEYKQNVYYCRGRNLGEALYDGLRILSELDAGEVST